MALARAAGEAMGRHVIVVADGPGFLVNRCGRPYGAEALRIVQEGIATPEQVDRICRLGGGFRMGPFELMDLVGIDVGYAVAQSFTELSFGEPRWKPSPLQARMVAAGRLGRKAGRGWYDYGDGPHRPEDPPPSGEADAGSFAARAEEAGAPLVSCARPAWPRRAPWTRSATACSSRWRAPGWWSSRACPRLRRPACDAAERAAADAGLEHEWVADAPGLVLGRIVPCLVNEAAFAVGEGVGSAEDVDAGMTHGPEPSRAGRRPGVRRSGWRRSWRPSTASGPSGARSATGPPRCCAGPPRWAPGWTEC